MSYRHLPLTCECGEVPDRILEVGLSDVHELVIHFWCAECRRSVCLTKPLTECWQECPPPETRQAAQVALVHTNSEADARFLRALGIRYPE